MKRVLGVLLSLMLLFGSLIVAPVSASAAEPYIKYIAAEAEKTMFAVLSDGTVWGWGYNGDKSINNALSFSEDTPICMNITDIKAIVSGGNAVYALKNDGTVFSWGNNAYGALGDGTTISKATPVQVKNLTNVKAISAGEHSGYALKNDGTVWAWGENGRCELGDGTTTQRNAPVQVKNLSDVKAISSGAALKNDGTVWAWGYNGSGQVGDGSITTRLAPVKVKILSGVKAIASGDNARYALKNDGTVWAWGQNLWGQVGDGNEADRWTSKLTPVQVKNLSGVTAIASSGDTAYALKSDGNVWAWGYDMSGELGNGTDGEEQFLPTQVINLTGVQSISAGEYCGYALKKNGTLWAWGYNGYGQLGDGTSIAKNIPVQVKFPMTLGESPVGSITLSPSSASIEQGKSVQLKATVKPTTAKVTWKSSDTDIATVSSSGLVKGIAPGTATITATNNETNYGVECKVTVFDKSAAFNVTTRTIQVGKTYTIVATVKPDQASNVYEWTSSNTAVATVNSQGKVTAKKAGTANIVLKVTFKDGKQKSAKCVVTVTK